MTTAEGLALSGSARATVPVESGRPTAIPGGPYRGGIAGGDFTPIQFEGNPPGFVEAEDIGEIQDWVWTFQGTTPHQTALEFDIDGEVIVTGYKGVTGTSPRTVAAWIRTSTIADQAIVHWGANSNGQRWTFRISADTNNGTQGAIRVEVQGGAHIGTTVVADGQWHHVAVVLPVVATPNITDTQLYVDGVLEGTSFLTANRSINTASADDVTIGNDHANRLFQGQISEVTIWDRALTVGEIRDIGLSRPLGNEPGLVGYLPLDDGAGTVARDLSVGGRNGDLQNNPQWVETTRSTIVTGIWDPTFAFTRAGNYFAGLRVLSEFGKWSSVSTTTVTVIDGKIEGFVRAADLRTPVREVRLTLTSSHVNPDVLAQIAAEDDRLNTTGDGGIWAETDDEGFYTLEHLPLGSFRIVASKGAGDDAHEFETAVQATDLTLKAPNQLAIDFVDLSVFPVGGRVVYSIQKNGVNVLVENVKVRAQPVGSASDIEALPSTTSLSTTGTNYSLPLFAGQYLFLAERPQHDIRIKDDTPGYDPDTGLVTIEDARTDIDFIDYTTRELTVFVVDSGGFVMSGRNITVSGDNGQAEDVSDDPDGKFVVTLNPGEYTVTVPGALTDDGDESEDVDLIAGDEAITLTIPVPIELSISPAPKLLDVNDDFLAQFGLTPDQNPEGFMFYYPPEPRTHTYTITATANGNPVSDFNLIVVDNVSQFTPDPAQEQAIFVEGTEGEYTVTAGLPNAVPDPVDPVNNAPTAGPKRISFRATKDKYQDSVLVEQEITVLGDVPEGTAARIVSVPIVNYLVLHDPPGDGSYTFWDDSIAVKEVIGDMKITANDGSQITVYPSPWRDERTISGFSFEKDPNSATRAADLGRRGLLGAEDPGAVLTPFALASAREAVVGAGVVVLGPVGYGVMLLKVAVDAAALSLPPSQRNTDILGVQYEIRPNRHLETPSGDSLPDLLGPGKGDVYFGEGWTLGLQTKYRLGLQLVEGQPPQLRTDVIETYDILERTNQYLYTIRDIENLVSDLNDTMAQIPNDPNDPRFEERRKLQSARSTWENLLNKNLAYQWNQNLRLPEADRQSFDAFRQSSGLPDETESETLIFSAGPAFEYSRTIVEGDLASYSTEISVGTDASFSHELEISAGFSFFGSGPVVKLSSGAEASVSTGQSYGTDYESGQEVEQTVGFVLQDDDIGDNITTHVYADPVWGTPVFFQNPGSLTSDPWETGTNRAINATLELLEEPTSGRPFDYHDGAHYKFRLTYTGQRKFESGFTTVDFLLYAPQTDNDDNLTVRFNGNSGPYPIGLTKESPSADIALSLYPPESDQENSAEKTYSVLIQAQEEADAQISRLLPITATFADLRAPRAVVIAPYEGERISPALFSTDAFKIEIVTEDTDATRIQLQIRAKQPDGVWEPWRTLSGMEWNEGDPNPDNDFPFERADRDPPRREFTFGWTESEIKSLGVGEYALRAVATDKATKPNFDLDPPVVTFLVDDSPPSVLTSVPFYQNRESKRIYRGELPVTFTDDMRGDDFSDRTFSVTDLLDNNKKVAGFVSYSPALRKAVFVPIVPFQPNGFYRAIVKTDEENADGTIDRGVRDLAGNPLDNTFVWTFRTTDAPFEEKWSITLSVTDGTATDANNIAAVDFGAEDEKDAHAVPALTNQLRLSFLDRNKVEFDRDIRPADGRLSHHWFLAIDNAGNGSNVTLRMRPSIKLTKSTRQYQNLRLIEFDSGGSVTNVIPIDPTQATVDPNTGQINEIDVHTYTNAGELSRTFRLDVEKAGFVATALQAGTSGWKFLSVPITPQRADPFVNLGDDIEEFKLYRYDTALGGYKIYPLDIGEVSVQTGHGYFTRLELDVEVDVGGSSNLTDVALTLDDAGWHAIGVPFVIPVNVAELQVGGKTFDQAVTDGDIEPTLYGWKVDASASDAYEVVDSSGQIVPWEGYWLKTKADNLQLTIPAPSGLANFQAPLPESYQPPAAPPVVEASEGFNIRLALTSDFSADVTTLFGTRSDASIGKDAFDTSEPPRLGQTAAVYFDHDEWGEQAGSYNTDYRPLPEVGESRKWKLTVFTDKPDSDMELSWEDGIGHIPDDTMMHFRRVGAAEWQDMRKVREVDIVSAERITKVEFDVHAERYAMSPPADVQVVAGEAQVRMQWGADDNPFISSYTIERQAIQGEPVVTEYAIRSTQYEFLDTDVAEEMSYTYQLSVRFKSGAELYSERFTVTVLPVIKETVLLQSYPNPFNPETWIPYELEKEADVTIEIYNVSGQLVRTLDLGIQSRGRYTRRERAAYWDGRTEYGERAASGVYFYLLRTGDFSATRKMVILK